MKEIALIFVGWLLGLLAPAITHRITLHYSRERIRDGLIREIKHLENTAASTFLMIEIHRGRFTKDILLWYSPYVSYDDLPPPFDKVKEALPRLTSLTEEMFSAATAHLAKPSDRGMHLKTFALPYSTVKLGDLELFSEDAARLVLTLISRISIINQQIETSRFYYNMTYDSSISQENHRSVSEQLLSIYDSVSTQVKLLVDTCKKAEDALQR